MIFKKVTEVFSKCQPRRFSCSQIVESIIFLICLIAIGSFSESFASAARKTASTSHFISDDGKEWPEFESTWSKLQEFYGAAMPAQVTIVFTDAGSSKFDTDHNRILLDRTHFQEQGDLVVAHETSHLCLNILTKGASSTEPFRFFDEGFAELISHRAVGSLENYRNNDALPTAAVQLKNNNVSFSKVQNWSVYFGGPKAGHWYAYEVGASFDFYILDQFGEARLKDFFISIGSTRDLGLSLQNVFGKSTTDFEVDWKSFLSKISLSNITPRIVELYPDNQSNSVPTDLVEAHVTFNTPMNTRIITLVADCNGICYKNAYWKSPTVLAIKIPTPLNPGTQYRAQLGMTGSPLTSQAGLPLPVTEWSFKTK